MGHLALHHCKATWLNVCDMRRIGYEVMVNYTPYEQAHTTMYLLVALSTVVRFAEHLAVGYIAATPLAPSCHVVGIHLL